jgi:hypothetical protein
VQLCNLRYPGCGLATDAAPPVPLLEIVGRQLHIDWNIWLQYAQPPETRREHLAELLSWLGLTTISISDYPASFTTLPNWPSKPNGASYLLKRWLKCSDSNTSSCLRSILSNACA